MEVDKRSDQKSDILDGCAPMFEECFYVEVLRPSQQLRSCRADQLPINTVPEQA